MRKSKIYISATSYICVYHITNGHIGNNTNKNNKYKIYITKATTTTTTKHALLLKVPNWFDSADDMIYTHKYTRESKSMMTIRCWSPRSRCCWRRSASTECRAETGRTLALARPSCTGWALGTGRANGCACEHTTDSAPHCVLSYLMTR